MEKHTQDLLVKGWEAQIKIASVFGDCCWKIRSWAFTGTTGILAYAFTSKAPIVALLALPLLMVLLILDAGYRRLQNQAISRTHELEEALNDLLAGESARLPEKGISTSLNTPELGELFALITPRRFLFWGPYVIAAVLVLAVFLILQFNLLGS